MDCQIIVNSFKINKNKNTGRVLYIVEGGRKEFTLIINIFTKILGFDYVHGVNRLGKEYGTLTQQKRINSKIYIINTENSNIGSIQNTNDFIQKQIDKIKEYDFDFNYEDIPIYYIFDCDRYNDRETTYQLINKLNNSREGSDFNSIGGVLLLSYPCIESYIISNFEEDVFKFYERVDSKTKVKQYINDNKYNFENMNIETLSNAFVEMIKSMTHLGISEIDIDDFKNINVRIFEEEKKADNKILLSLLLISFIDLGIIEWKVV